MKGKQLKTRTYDYKGWEIEGIGGFCTVRRFTATKDDKTFWMFKLKEVKAQIVLLEYGIPFELSVRPLYRQPLYV